MRFANNIKVSVFVKPEEDEASIKKHLLALFPFDLEQEKIIFNRSNATGFNQKEIVILEVDLKKERHTNAFLNFLKEKLNEQQKSVLVKQENRLDDECNLFIRLDKNKLLNNEFWITDSGECYHIRISIAAFPKKKEKARVVVEKIFS
nr:hypothetical protein [Nanoarchaeota archaeon]